MGAGRTCFWGRGEKAEALVISPRPPNLPTPTSFIETLSGASSLSQVLLPETEDPLPATHLLRTRVRPHDWHPCFGGGSDSMTSLLPSRPVSELLSVCGF